MAKKRLRPQRVPRSHSQTIRRRPKTRAIGKRAPRRLVPRARKTYQRALKALAEMRRGASLATASRAQGLKPDTVKRHVGHAIRRRTPGGRFYALSTDALEREMVVQTTTGPEPLVIRGLTHARLVSAHANAIAQYNRNGDPEVLRPFEGRTIRSGRRTVTLLTDPVRIHELAEADALTVDSLYRDGS